MFKTTLTGVIQQVCVDERFLNESRVYNIFLSDVLEIFVFINEASVRLKGHVAAFLKYEHVAVGK